MTCKFAQGGKGGIYAWCALTFAVKREKVKRVRATHCGQGVDRASDKWLVIFSPAWKNKRVRCVR